MDMFGKLGWFFKQERKAYIFGISMLILLSVMTVLVPMINRIMIDYLSVGTITCSQLVMLSVILVVITIFQYEMHYVWRTKIFGTSAKLEKILRARLFTHFTQMDSIFFQKYRTGDLMARTT